MLHYSRMYSNTKTNTAKWQQYWPRVEAECLVKTLKRTITAMHSEGRPWTQNLCSFLRNECAQPAYQYNTNWISVCVRVAAMLLFQNIMYLTFTDCRDVSYQFFSPRNTFLSRWMAAACVFDSSLTGLYLQDWETKGLIPAAAHCWHQPPCKKVGSASPLDYISSGGVFHPGSHPFILHIYPLLHQTGFC